MTSADILKQEAEWEEENIVDGERNYEVILNVEDYENYCELRNRPIDWSEKKASLGLVSSHMNANMVPLGSRKRKLSHTESSPPMFDPVEWKGWKPISKDEADRQFISGTKMEWQTSKTWLKASRGR